MAYYIFAIIKSFYRMAVHGYIGLFFTHFVLISDKMHMYVIYV